jgi:hypothetical protein
VDEYHKNPKTRELVINDNLFILYELTITPPEKEGDPTLVSLGKQLKRAYWRDATGLTPEQVKSILGIR